MFGRRLLLYYPGPGKLSVYFLVGFWAFQITTPFGCKAVLSSYEPGNGGIILGGLTFFISLLSSSLKPKLSTGIEGTVGLMPTGYLFGNWV